MLSILQQVQSKLSELTNWMKTTTVDSLVEKIESRFRDYFRNR